MNYLKSEDRETKENINMITYTRLRCNNCNIIIQCNTISYIAFDGVYCSNMCRNEKAKVIKAIDPTYNYPSKWQPIIRRTKSCLDVNAHEGTLLPQHITHSNSSEVFSIKQRMALSHLNIIIEREKNDENPIENPIKNPIKNPIENPIIINTEKNINKSYISQIISYFIIKKNYVINFIYKFIYNTK